MGPMNGPWLQFIFPSFLKPPSVGTICSRKPIFFACNIVQHMLHHSSWTRRPNKSQKASRCQTRNRLIGSKKRKRQGIQDCWTCRHHFASATSQSPNGAKKGRHNLPETEQTFSTICNLPSTCFKTDGNKGYNIWENNSSVLFSRPWVRPEAWKVQKVLLRAHRIQKAHLGGQSEALWSPIKVLK